MDVSCSANIVFYSGVMSVYLRRFRLREAYITPQLQDSGTSVRRIGNEASLVRYWSSCCSRCSSSRVRTSTRALILAHSRKIPASLRCRKMTSPPSGQHRSPLCEQMRDRRGAHYAILLAGTRRINSTARHARPTTVSSAAAWTSPAAGTPSNTMLAKREAA